MIKKTRKVSKGGLQKKCDRLLQELGRKIYSGCLVCGKPISCLHHYFPKSMSATLRYDLENCIPICAGCHFSHHNGNPVIHATVLRIRGQEWHDKLLKKKGIIAKTDIGYYREMEEKLTKIAH